MAKKEVVRLQRPKPDSPINNPADAKIVVVVSGRMKISSPDRHVEVKRKE